MVDTFRNGSRCTRSLVQLGSVTGLRRPDESICCRVHFNPQAEAPMRKAVSVVLFASLAVLLTSRPAQAQRAEITGHVADPQGAAVINAHVVARNVATGVENS